MTQDIKTLPTSSSFFDKCVEFLTVIFFTVLMLIVFLQFCTRYILNDSLAWTEEIARYLLVVLVFTGSLMLVQRGEHIFLEVTYRLSARPNTKPLAIFSSLISTTYYIILAVFGFVMAMNTEQALISVPFSKAYIYVFISVTIALSVFSCALRTVSLCNKSSDEIFQDIESSSGDLE